MLVDDNERQALPSDLAFVVIFRQVTTGSDIDPCDSASALLDIDENVAVVVGATDGK